MAQLPEQFDATNVEPRQAFDLLPAGWYKVMVTESEMKDTNDGRGKYLQLTLQVLEGPHTNRLMWDRLNLINASQTAVTMARESLSAICHSVGIMSIKDSNQLHNKPLMAKVKITPPKGDYDAKNEVKGYKAIDMNQPVGNPVATPAGDQPQAGQTDHPEATQAAPASYTPPWG